MSELSRGGSEFLGRQFPKTAESPGIASETAVEAAARHENITDKAAYKRIDVYLDRLEAAFTHPDAAKAERYKSFYFKRLSDSLVIGKDDIADSYWQHQEKIALDRGHGHLEYTQDLKDQEATTIAGDQKESLQSWFDYLTTVDNGDTAYPTWFRYYAFRSMTKLGGFDKENGEFAKRTGSTTAPFPELNREALATVYSLLNQTLTETGKVDLKSLSDTDRETLSPQLLKHLPDAKFSRLYADCLMELDRKQEASNACEGEWIKYDQGSDPQVLFDSIHGKGTGWCTAGGIETAQVHLDGGDFYVYYVYDQDHQPTVPKIAIRTSGGAIAEVRGTDAGQNLSNATLASIAQEKYHTLPGGEKYDKKTADMAALTAIYDQWQKQPDSPLTDENLRFLYGIDSKIEGFGYKEDPRIEEILNKRDSHADLSHLFNCRPDQISFTKEEALGGDIVYHHGNLDLDGLTSAEGLVLPENVGGNLDLRGLTSAKGLVLPENVGGDLHLGGLTSVKSLVLSENVGGNLYLGSLTTAEGLVLPENVGGNLYLRNLTRADGLVLPESVRGDLDLRSLTSAEGLVLPENVGGELYLGNLISAKGLVLPENIGGNLDLHGLTSAKGLVLPEGVRGNLDLSGLTSAKGLVLPENIGENLYLSSLTSAKGLVLPESVGKNLDLRGLTSAKGLVLPENIGENLYLSSLTSADGLVLPESVRGNLDLSGLTSTKGLVLPENIEGNLDLRSLTSADGLVLPENVGGNLDLRGLTSAKGLVLPEKTKCVYLHGSVYDQLSPEVKAEHNFIPI